ncbi:MAG: hypothetical protein ABJB05_06620 [Parafilimonas sp.]
MKALQEKVNIELYPATIIQVNTSARKRIFTDEKFYQLTANTLRRDVIIKLKNSNKTLPLNIRNKQLPLHKKQEVDIISANKCIIGYVDVKKEEYYYLTNNFCKVIGFNIPAFFITWITGIVAAASTLIFIENNYKPLLAGILLMLTFMIHVSIKSILNKKIENEIDECMKSFSIV